MPSPANLAPSPVNLAAPVPAELLPAPVNLPQVEQVPVDAHHSAAQQLMSFAERQGDPGMVGYRWHDDLERTYRVRTYAPEDNQVDEFGVNYGLYNTLTKKTQKGIDKLQALAELATFRVVKFSEIGPVFSGEPTLFKGVSKGVAGPYWKGHATIDRIRETGGARTVDVFDTDGTLLHSIPFRNDDDFAAYIDRNVKKEPSAGHDKHGHHEKASVIPWGFQHFEHELDVPIANSDPIDIIPLSGYPGDPISINAALAQKRRLGGDLEGSATAETRHLGGLAGLTWTDALGRKRTIQSDTVQRVFNEGSNQKTHLEAAVYIETTNVTKRRTFAGATAYSPSKRARRLSQDAAPGGTVLKRVHLMTYNDLQKHFEELAKSGKSADAHWELPAASDDNPALKFLRGAELRRLQEEHHQIRAAELGRYITGQAVQQPERDPNDPNDRAITLRQAITLLSRPDHPEGLNARVQHNMDHVNEHPEAFKLQWLVNELGAKYVGETADSLLKGYQSTLHRVGLHRVADEASISTMLAVLAERHYEATAHPDQTRRSDHLTPGDPFSITAAGLQVRQEILDLLIGSAYRDFALEPVVGSLNDNNGESLNDEKGFPVSVLKGYRPRKDITSLLPPALIESMHDLLGVGKQLDNPDFSNITLLNVGALLRTTWVHPHEKQLKLQTAQLQREREALTHPLRPRPYVNSNL